MLIVIQDCVVNHCKALIFPCLYPIIMSLAGLFLYISTTSLLLYKESLLKKPFVIKTFQWIKIDVCVFSWKKPSRTIKFCAMAYAFYRERSRDLLVFNIKCTFYSIVPLKLQYIASSSISSRNISSHTVMDKWLLSYSHEQMDYSPGQKKCYKFCFIKQKWQLWMDVAQYRNVAVPLSSTGSNTKC